MLDSESLTTSFQARSIDYVIDVESSFFYPDKAAFLREVNVVLKEDGIFLFAVPSFRTHLDQLYHDIKRNFFILREDDITDNVLRALHLDSDRLQRYIDDHFPIGLRTLMKQAWAVEGTFLNGLVADRTIIYKAFVLKKRLHA